MRSVSTGPGFTPTTNAPAPSHTEVETQVLVLVCRSLTHSEPAPITLPVHLCKKPSRLARLPPRGAGSESHSPYQAAKIRTAKGPCKRVARWSRTVRIRCAIITHCTLLPTPCKTTTIPKKNIHYTCSPLLAAHNASSHNHIIDTAHWQAPRRSHGSSGHPKLDLGRAHTKQGSLAHGHSVGHQGGGPADHESQALGTSEEQPSR